MTKRMRSLLKGLPMPTASANEVDFTEDLVVFFLAIPYCNLRCKINNKNLDFIINLPFFVFFALPLYAK